MAETPTVRTEATGSTLEVILDGGWSHYVHVDTPADAYMHRSDQYAEFAVGWANVERFITAEVCAELADAYALISRLLKSAEDVYCDAELPPLLAAAIRSPSEDT